MIKAAIFDMDGLITDTEPLWREVETDVFARLGIALQRTDLEETTGLRISEVVSLRYHQKPWKGPGVDEVEKEILDRLEDKIYDSAKPFDGLEEILQLFEEKNLRIALASSSPRRIIHSLLQKFDIFHRFEAICSAEDEKFGKPHPAVYLRAAAKLDTSPLHCLALEDSFNGTVSAKAARMRVVTIPEPALYDDPRFAISDLKLPSLSSFKAHHLESMCK